MEDHEHPLQKRSSSSRWRNLWIFIYCQSSHVCKYCLKYKNFRKSLQKVGCVFPRLVPLFLAFGKRSLCKSFPLDVICGRTAFSLKCIAARYNLQHKKTTEKFIVCYILNVFNTKIMKIFKTLLKYSKTTPFYKLKGTFICILVASYWPFNPKPLPLDISVFWRVLDAPAEHPGEGEDDISGCELQEDFVKCLHGWRLVTWAELLHVWEHSPVHQDRMKPLQRCRTLEEISVIDGGMYITCSINADNERFSGTPGWNHLLRSFDTRSSCWHLGNAGSGCVWMSWMWLMMEVHLATFSGAECELVADQYRWLVMLLRHFFSKPHSFSREMISSFFDNPDEVQFTWIFEIRVPALSHMSNSLTKKLNFRDL